MTLIFATNNIHKVTEIKAVLPSHFNIITLQEAGIDIDIPEPFETLEQNAETKAITIHRLTSQDCFSEDTGLEVDALGGTPGVLSARYAGEEKSFQKNIDKLLHNLQGTTNRDARFRTVICLLLRNETFYFEGICRGRIIAVQKGSGGFGYDPVFIPEGAGQTFGEMSLPEKNTFSHRKKAVDKLVTFLNQCSLNK